VASGSALAADKAYISVDESGQVQASDVAPATGAVEEVVPLPSSTESDDTVKAQQEVDRIKQKADQMATERKQREQERAAAKDEMERKKVACEASKSRLQQLESQPPNRRLVISPDGTADRVTAEEMEQILSAARNQVKQDCAE
jgi:hypothetical protein